MGQQRKSTWAEMKEAANCGGLTLLGGRDVLFRELRSECPQYALLRYRQLSLAYGFGDGLNLLAHASADSGLPILLIHSPYLQGEVQTISLS